MKLKLKQWLIASAILFVSISIVRAENSNKSPNDEASMTLELSPEIDSNEETSIANGDNNDDSSRASQSADSQATETMAQASSTNSAIKLPTTLLEEPKQLSPSASAYFENYLKDLQAGYGRRNQKAEIVEPESLSEIPSIAQAYKFREFNQQVQQPGQYYQTDKRPIYDGSEQMIPAPSNQSPTYDSESQETRADISQYVSPPRDVDENGFTPIGMSVEEAFKKYFPAAKPVDGQIENNQDSTHNQAQSQMQNHLQNQVQNHDQESHFASQYQFQSNNNQFDHQQDAKHHQQLTPNHHQASSTQYFETVQPTPQPALPESSPPQKDFNIDALRSIVESQPLAKPNPFDPPSPPLSAFLPPPEVQPGATLLPGTVTQYGASNVHNEEPEQPLSVSHAQPMSSQQSPLAQALVQQQPPVPVADYTRLQPSSSEQSGGRIPESSAQVIQYQQMGPNVGYEGSHSMPSAQSLVQSLPSPSYQQNQDTQAQASSQPEATEDDEDEGAAYQTVPMDETGKRLPPGYSQPVDFAELEKSNAVADAQQFQSQRNQPQNLMMETPQQPQNQIVYGSIPSDNQFNNGPSSSAPMYEEPQNMPDNQAPASIEYGGFVPIKKTPQQESFGPMSHQAPAPYDMVPQQPQSQPQHQQQHQPQHQSQHQPQQSIGSQNFGSDNSINVMPVMQSLPPQHQQRPQHYPQNNMIQQGHQKPVFRPYFGKDAIRKLNEMGISEEDFYKTVQKVMKSNYVKNLMSSNGITGKPMHQPKNFMFPKANFYRRPNKNRNHAPQGPLGPKPPMSNFEDININYFKDELPPGASYNPRDVGLDETVLAQIHMLDSGIGGYRYPPSGPAAFGAMAPFRSKRPGFGKKAPKSPMQFASLASVPLPAFFYPMNKNKPMRPVGYRFPVGFVPGSFGAASEIKQQFQPVPKPGKVGAFKFLSSATSEPISAVQGNSDESSNGLSNIFGIKPIKGIKSLVSYLTGGAPQAGRR